MAMTAASRCPLEPNSQMHSGLQAYRMTCSRGRPISSNSFARAYTVTASMPVIASFITVSVPLSQVTQKKNICAMGG